MPSRSEFCRVWQHPSQRAVMHGVIKGSLPEEFPHELAEVDSLLRDEVERQLTAVPLVLSINHFHRELPLLNFHLAEGQRLIFVLALRHQKPTFIRKFPTDRP